MDEDQNVTLYLLVSILTSVIKQSIEGTEQWFALRRTCVYGIAV